VTLVAAPDKAPDRIAGMFDAIAPRYDLLNHVLSAGIDKRWRSRAIRSLHLTGNETVLDVCTGTADVALEARSGARPASDASSAPRDGASRVIGVDFAGAMLRRGLGKVRAAGEGQRILLVRGDAMKLPVGDGRIDAATAAFGIRNVLRPDEACAEMARALRPGGRLAILEFGIPRLPGVKALYMWYFSKVLPWVGRVISGHSAAYSYLPASVGSFPAPVEFMAVLQRAGFAEVKAIPLTFGIVYLYTGRKI
jgi:demethylmenaquinone methyltransferase/2-methoxy-6-polyprenyl-1,4-benzoquinol methylase